MSEPVNALVCLAQDDGARFRQGSESDRWVAEDRDGMAIVSGAMSIAEAARLYCEDKELIRDGMAVVFGAMSIAEAEHLYCEDKGLSPPHEVLARIVAGYRPYDVLAEFWEGFAAYHRRHVFWCNPYQDDKGVKKQAWDRGADAARQYQQALSHMATTPAEAGDTEPGWTVRLLANGRR
jgi:hypothetical protein